MIVASLRPIVCKVQAAVRPVRAAHQPPASLLRSWTCLSREGSFWTAVVAQLVSTKASRRAFIVLRGGQS